MQKRREYDRQSTERDIRRAKCPAPRLEIAFCFVHPLVLCHLPYTCLGDDGQRGCSSSLLISLKKVVSLKKGAAQQSVFCLGKSRSTEMPWSRVLSFTDPFAYQSAFRSVDVELFPTAKGKFCAELTQVSMNRLWIHG